MRSRVAIVKQVCGLIPPNKSCRGMPQRFQTGAATVAGSGAPPLKRRLRGANVCKTCPRQARASRPNTAASVLAELETLCAHKEFARSRRQTDFLRYVVQAVLRGEGGQIKEYTLGLEAFGKVSDFDPKIDSSVRSEASRIRAKLDKIYAAEPEGHPVRIVLTRGGYAPVFEGPRQASGPALEQVRIVTPPLEPSHPGNGARTLALAIAAAALLAAGLYWRPLDRLPPMRLLPLTTDAGFEMSPRLLAGWRPSRLFLGQRQNGWAANLREDSRESVRAPTHRAEITVVHTGDIWLRHFRQGVGAQDLNCLRILKANRDQSVVGRPARIMWLLPTDRATGSWR